MNKTRHEFFCQALLKIRPGSEWTLMGEDYDDLIWLEPPPEEGGQEKPTQEEVEAELQRLQDIYDRTEYQRLRAPEYPDFREYLDGVVKGDQQQIQAYIDACLAVKAKYPKPE